MKKILGLDLGTTSIGWAVVNEADNDTEKSSIIDLGVRLVNLSANEQTHFLNAKSGTTANADRTLARGARRRLQRYRQRRQFLVNIMKEHGFVTDETVLFENGKQTTFETCRLRAKAATEEISLQELARVLLRLNKQRGYKSSRKDDASNTGFIVDDLELAMRLRNDGITPGEHSYRLLKKGQRKLPDFYRSDLCDEMARIWRTQASYHPEISDKLMEEITGKTESQTWAILSRALNLVGLKRQYKGYDLKLDNYRLRALAANGPVTLEELAIVAGQINREISDASGYLNQICELSKILRLNGVTIGQYMMARLDENPNTNFRNMVFSRKDHINEFDTIWRTQAQYHPELTDSLRDKIRDSIIYYQRPLKSKKGLVSICEFEQEEIQIERDGKTVTKTVGNKVIPRSSPLFQEFRIWQTINNIIVSVKGGHKKPSEGATPSLFDDELYVNGARKLTIQEMSALASELTYKDKMSKAEIIKLLFGKTTKLDLNFKTVDGNATMRKLYEAYSKALELSGHVPLNFHESASQIHAQASDEFAGLGWNTAVLDFDSEKPLDDQPSFKLWHLLYSYEGDASGSGVDSLINHISKITGIDKDYCGEISSMTFVDDYGSLSAKAIKKILPGMKDGMRYDQACENAGYRHSKSSLTREEIAGKTLKPRLELLPKGSLRNPIVEKILNQMVNVVNALMDGYGHFDEIRVELARELKKNATERELMTKSINAATKENNTIKQSLVDEFNISHPSKNDIIRYKLYKELAPLGYKTLYSGRYIPREMLFGKEIDIEHIIPQARLLDDSLSNKTLEFRDVNMKKRDRTAYDFVESEYGEAGLAGYIGRCEECYLNNKAKLRKLMTREAEIPDNFVDRDLRNTQFIAKKALSMLSEVTRSVVATSGTITAKLREDWQLIDTMKELNWDKYDSLGLTEHHTNREGKEIYRIKNWTKRDDNRHHAMDALTIAFTKDVFIQYFNNKSASYRPGTNECAIKSKYERDGKILPPIPLGEFRAAAKSHLESIITSIKAKNKVVTRNVNKTKRKGSGAGQNMAVQLTPRGQLHKATIYGSHDIRVKTTEKVDASFDEAKISTVSSKLYRRALLNRLQEFHGDAAEAFTDKNSPAKKPVWVDESHSQAVPPKVEVIKTQRKYTLRKEVDESLDVNRVVDPKIREVLKARLDEKGTAKAAFSDLVRNPIWLNEEKGICVKRVTCYVDANPIALRTRRRRDGTAAPDGQLTDFVNTSNNHHAAIYRIPVTDKNGIPKTDCQGNAIYKLTDVVVSFLEAVTRAENGLPIIDKEYRRHDGWEFLFSLKQNEFFLFHNEKTGFDPKEIDLSDKSNYPAISANLFRVQSISVKDYYFRHHLETNVNEAKELKGITWKRIKSMGIMDKIVKVRINHVGQIVKVGEY